MSHKFWSCGLLITFYVLKWAAEKFENLGKL